MQVVNAFGAEVKDAFSVFLYNWTRDYYRLRSIYKRLNEFEKAINFNKPLSKVKKSDVRAMELYKTYRCIISCCFFIIGIGYYIGKKIKI